MNIAFIGYGRVGGALAVHLVGLGHRVTLAARDPESDRVRSLVLRAPSLRVATPHEAVREAEVVFLATPFGANRDALEPVMTELRGKILVDCTNPVGPGLTHGLGSEHSGTEMLQSWLPETAVVKAFTIYGFENFEDSSYPAYEVKPAMLFCGDDAEAKERVAELIAQLGWEPVDVGGAVQAVHLEHMTLLWVRMVRMGRQSPNLVWAALRR